MSKIKSKNSEDKKPENIKVINNTDDRDETIIQNEYGGPKGKEPTRYGDWEKKGRCIDF